MLATLDEGRARWSVAHKAIEWGHGGMPQVQERTGFSPPTIAQGRREWREPKGLRMAERRRRAGGGRKRREVLEPTLRRDLDRIMDDNTRGAALSRLRWSRTSTERMAAEMTPLGHPLSADTVSRWRQPMEAARPAPVQVKEGERPPHRDGLCRALNEPVKA